MFKLIAPNVTMPNRISSKVRWLDLWFSLEYDSVPDWLITVHFLFGEVQISYPLPEKGINRFVR